MIRAFVTAAVIVSSSLLMSCGGGGGGSSPEDTPVSLAPSVPAASYSKVARIVSLSSSIEGTSGRLSIEKNGEAIVAYDESDNLILGAVSTGSKALVLDATSTAVLLVRFALAIPRGLSESQLLQAIEQAPSLPSLVDAVQRALDSGNLPATVSEVLNLITQVSRELALSGSPALLAKALPVDDSAEDAPFTIFSPGLGSVSLEGDLKVKNTTPLIWDINVETDDGRSLTPGFMSLPSATLSQRVANFFSDWPLIGVAADYFGVIETSVPNEGKTFQMRVLQSEDAQVANVVSVWFDLFIEASSGTIEDLSPNCRGLIVSSLTASAIEAVRSGTPASALDAIGAFSATAINEALESSPDFAFYCTISTRTLLRNYSRLLASRIVVAYGVYKTATTAVSVASIGEKMWLISRTFLDPNSFDDTFTVCVGKGPAGVGLRVVNCATRYEIVPEMKRVTAGTFFAVDVKAYRYDDLTVIPASLEYFPTDADPIARWSAGSRINSYHDGKVQVYVHDPITDIGSEVVEFVVSPNSFGISSKDIQLGETATFSLKTAAGEVVDQTGATNWEFTVPGVVTFADDTTVKHSSLETTFTVKAIAEGETTLVAHNETDGSYASVNITVIPPKSRWVIEYELQNCNDLTEKTDYVHLYAIGWHYPCGGCDYGKIYLENEGGDPGVIFEAVVSRIGPYFALRSIIPGTADLDAPQFGFSLPQEFKQIRLDQFGEPVTVGQKGDIKLDFVVDYREPTFVAGTFTSSGFVTYSILSNASSLSTYRLENSQCRGNWSARRSVGSYAPTKMNGADICGSRGESQRMIPPDAERAIYQPGGPVDQWSAQCEYGS